MNRNLIILGGLLVIVGAIYSFTSRSRSYVDTTGGFVDLYDGTLATSDVFGIDAYTGSNVEGGFSLVKRGDDWVMSSHHDAPANVNKIRTLLGNIEGAEGEVRSDDASVLSAYDLGEDEAVHLTVKNEAGDPMVSLLVGKRSGQGGFVRMSDSNQALLSAHNFLSDLGIWGQELGDPNTSSWLDLETFKVDRDQVHAIELISAGSTVAMAKEFEETEAPADSAAAAAMPPTPPAHEWRVTSPSTFLAKKSVADGILGSLASVRARDVVGRDVDNPDYGLAGDGDRVVLTLAGGESHTLHFGQAFADDESQLYFRVDDQDLVWALPSYLRDNIFKPESDLKPE